jgi:hypothetical protein
LAENGGVGLTKFWANSVLSRLNSSKRKGAKAAKKLPDNFSEVKSDFLARITETVTEHDIPAQLIASLDETGVRIMPVSNWTLAAKGSKSVSVVGIDDKRKLTVLLACTPCGELLPPQILYQGTTERCHARHQFPKDWDVWHSSSHWSTEETFTRYIETVLCPWAAKTKVKLDLPECQRSLVVLDVYAAQRTAGVLKELKKRGFEVQFVLVNCTSELQPLDLTVNVRLRRTREMPSVSGMLTVLIKEAVQAHGDDADSAVASLRPDLRLSTLKPLHARWLVDSIKEVQAAPSMISQGWEAAGILEVLNVFLPRLLCKPCNLSTSHQMRSRTNRSHVQSPKL